MKKVADVVMQLILMIKIPKLFKFPLFIQANTFNNYSYHCRICVA